MQKFDTPTPISAVLDNRTLAEMRTLADIDDMRLMYHI